MNKLTEKQTKAIIDEIIILVDTREHLPNHITEAFDKYGVKWEKKKLHSGDYSARVPLIEELQLEEINLENELIIERKMGLLEIQQNLTTHKDRFNKEFDRTNAKAIILIENDTYKDLALGKYNSDMNPKSFLGLLHSFSDKHNADFIFINKECSALFIYNIFKYRIKNILKQSTNNLKSVDN